MPTPASAPTFSITASPLPPGLSVIEASAGTGKTYAISHLVPRLLIDGTISSLSQILLVTFTNAAARELSDRTRSVLTTLAHPPAADEKSTAPDLHLLREMCPDHLTLFSKALLQIDQLEISTIHSFCQKVLQSNGTLCGFPAAPELIPNASAETHIALYDLWQKHIASCETFSRIATLCGWSFGDDLTFLQKTLPLDTFHPIPTPRPYQDLLKEISAFRPTPSEYADFLSLCKSVKKWAKSGLTEEYRNTILATADPAKNLSVLDAGFFDAMDWIARLPDHINGTSSKKEKAAAASLPLVVRCQQFLRDLADLRWSWQISCATEIQETLETALKKKGQITYDGLIRHLRSALHAEPEGDTLRQILRTRYRVALIDESQDTDPAQMDIFQRIFTGEKEETHRLILIGDPKQAIYGFRNADLNTYLAAKNTAQTHYTLTKTFRSPPELVQGVNALFSSPNPFLHEGIVFNPASSGLSAGSLSLEIDGKPVPPLNAWLVPESDAESYGNKDNRSSAILGRTSSYILHLLENASLLKNGKERRPVLPKDIAVLVSSNKEAEEFADALKKRKIPAIIASQGDIFGSNEARFLQTLLRAVASPKNRKLRFAALATPLLGKTAEEIAAIRKNPEEDTRWLDWFCLWSDTWMSHGISACLAQIDESQSVSLRLASGARGERVLTNFRQLCDLLQTAAVSSHPRPSQLLGWFSQQIASQGELSDERQIQLESDAEAVQILTIHKSKGLEFSIVFCPFLWKYPSKPNGHPPFETVRKSAAAIAGHPLPADAVIRFSEIQDPWKTILEPVAMAELLRLAYVALTRAKIASFFFAGALGTGQKPTPHAALDWLFRKNPSDVSFGQWKSTTAEKSRNSSHEEFLDNLLAADSSLAQILCVQPPPDASEGIYAGLSAQKSAPLLACAPKPHIPLPWTITSFSSLTREAHAHGDPDQAPVKDSDDLPVPAALPPGTISSPPGNPSSPATRFLTAKKGASIGTLVHEWIERWDFSELSANNLADLASHTKKYPIGTDEEKQQTVEAFADLLPALRLAELPSMGKLSEICSAPSASEWHFHLPLKPSFSIQNLASVFQANGFPDYADSLRELGAAKLEGFLQGYIDRLAVAGDRWAVIDWKTNSLGGSLADYSLPSMLHCAKKSHYFLQVHLYLVALRRYLKLFLTPSSLGGAALVFLRGIRKDGSGGILHFTPTTQILDELDQLFS